MADGNGSNAITARLDAADRIDDLLGHLQAACALPMGSDGFRTLSGELQEGYWSLLSAQVEQLAAEWKQYRKGAANGVAAARAQ